jgi:DNA-binding NarL/FixJ family response regulator
MTEISVLIADDLEHVRQGLRTILELAGGLTVIGEACTGLEAIQQVQHLQPDVVLMDLAMPHVDGLEATEQIKAQRPETGVVMISIHDSVEAKAQAARVGADAFLAKGTETEILVRTIQEVGGKAQGKRLRTVGEG